MTAYFESVETDVVLTASELFLRARISWLFEQFERLGRIPSCRLLASMPSMLLGLHSVEHPRVRHWVTTGGALVAAWNRQRDPSASAAAHIQLDGLDASRLGELHFLHALSAWIDRSLYSEASFELEVSVRPPRILSLGSLGDVYFHDEPSQGGVSIAAAGELVEVRTRDAHIRIHRNGTPLVQDGGRFCNGITAKTDAGVFEFPVHDAGLTDPQWATAPIVRGKSAVRAWALTFGSAASRIALFSPAVAAACQRLAPCILPLHFSSGVAFSSSSSEHVLGLTFLPAVPEVDDVAESLIHEALHQKLFHLESVASPFQKDSPTEERYYSPWRTDARPLRMVLHGAYVFVGVGDYWHWRSTNDDAPQSRGVALLRALQSLRAVETVHRHAHLSSVGQKIVSAINRHAERLAEMHSDIPEASAVHERLCAHRDMHAAWVE